jgi:hypothetical protein
MENLGVVSKFWSYCSIKTLQNQISSRESIKKRVFRKVILNLFFSTRLLITYELSCLLLFIVRSQTISKFFDLVQSTKSKAVTFNAVNFQE